jgi:hypothetical protein
MEEGDSEIVSLLLRYIIAHSQPPPSFFDLTFRSEPQETKKTLTWPEETINALERFVNFSSPELTRRWANTHPYLPDNEEKLVLSLQTGLTPLQILNWMKNYKRAAVQKMRVPPLTEIVVEQIPLVVIPFRTVIL